MPATAATVQDDQAEAARSGPAAPAWGAVFAIAVTVATLLTSELLPGSLLTPMAHDLGLSEGMAGQAVTATALSAMVSSLLIGTVARRFDRRRVVMAFSVLLTASSLIVALAPSFLLLLAGRILLGFALGGFWSLAASLAMRLAPPADVPKALSIVFSGVSVAMVIAAPVGTLLGAVVGWRGVFLLAAALGAVCWLWQAGVLPAMPPRDRVEGSGISQVARRPGVGLAMLAIFCVFAGQFAFFTYMRPFFEAVTGLGVNGLSALLLLFGIANFAGTSMASATLNASLKLTLALTALLIAVCAAGLVATGDNAVAAAVLTAIWGFLFGAVPVGWSTWVTRNVPDDAENAGGLQVAVIQLANTVGAALGGFAFDKGGPAAPLITAAVLMAATTAIVLSGVRSGPGCAKGELE